MDFEINANGKIYRIDISENKDENVLIKVGGKSFNFDSEKNENKNFKSISEFAKGQRALSKKELKASISGLISEIFVKENEEVKKGQKMLTLLAMKMENEIVSEGDGKIKKIMVKPNQSVRENEILIVFE